MENFRWKIYNNMERAICGKWYALNASNMLRCVDICDRIRMIYTIWVSRTFIILRASYRVVAIRFRAVFAVGRFWLWSGWTEISRNGDIKPRADSSFSEFPDGGCSYSNGMKSLWSISRFSRFHTTGEPEEYNRGTSSKDISDHFKSHVPCPSTDLFMLANRHTL